MKKHIFDLSGLTVRQSSIIQEAINKMQFDTMLLEGKLKAEKGKTRIPVEFIDCNAAMGGQKLHDHHIHVGDDKAHPLTGSVKQNPRRRVLGLAWYSGKVSIDTTLEENRELAIEVFLAEGAHMVDFFYMTQEMRDQIFHVFHGGDKTKHDHGWFEETGNDNYWSWVGESFMAGFTVAYTSLKVDDSSFVHRVTPEMGKQIRSILTPAKQGKYFRTRSSEILHDLHGGLKPYHYYNFIYIGAKKCRVCKPV